MTTDTEDERLISIELLHPNPDNPRLEAGDVTELAHSIEEVGLIQALLVRPSAIEDGEFIIEAGYRRWVAMRALKFAVVRCHVRIPQPGEDLVTRNLVVGLVENEREGLTPVEKARALGRLRDEKGMTQTEIAAATGWHLSTVSRYMTLHELSPRTQAAVASGQLGVEDAIRLVRQQRTKQRRRKGHKPTTGAQWEPDWFTATHPLARTARQLCQVVRQHSKRRLLGKVACGECWDTAIREDQTLVVEMRYKQAPPATFMPPNGAREQVS